MQLKLADNIKLYRKKMELTQESLAEALGVTVGAVSKWENGNNVPDVMMMMELADFFNISVDELLGYDISSKNVDDICASIEKAYDRLDFDRAVKEANEAMTRYPHNFKVLYTCGDLYYYKSVERKDRKKNAETAIRIYKTALSYISQNRDPDISEFSIKEKIAVMYRRVDPEKALEQLKEINYEGRLSASIAATLMELDRREEALDNYTIALLIHFAEQYEVSTNAALALAASGKPGDIRKAIELVKAEMTVADIYAVPGKITYIQKLKSVLYIQEGWWHACLGEIGEMKRCVEEAYALATSFDRAGVTADIAASIRFNYFSKKSVSTHDSLGTTAVDGIEGIFAHEVDPTTKKNHKYMQCVIEYWNSLKQDITC